MKHLFAGLWALSLLLYGMATALPKASIAELRSLCGEAGLNAACALLNDFELEHTDSLRGTSLIQESAWWDKLKSNNKTIPEGGCAQPGALVFHHVMKTGGLAVDEFLACRCLHGGCSVKLHELPIDHPLGFERCDPSVCSFHGNMRKIHSFCAGFATSKRFTVLRNPVDRVWSFYNYIGRWYQPFQNRSLESILESYGEDLNAGISDANKRCSMCRDQLANIMALRSFCPTCGYFNDRMPSHQEVAAGLEVAKQTLRSMDAVFLTEDVDKLPELFDSLPDLFPKRAGNAAAKTPKQCQVKHRNPSTYKQDAPSDQAVKLIQELNWADVELYEYALTLPNLKRPLATEE